MTDKQNISFPVVVQLVDDLLPPSLSDGVIDPYALEILEVHIGRKEQGEG
jgi:hypothetical protein